MKDLIERLEKAPGPDRQLDRDIAKACGMHWSSDEDGNYGPYGLMPRRVWFTSSLDAAQALVPPEHAASVEWSPSFPGCAWVYPPDNVHDISFEGEASSPAIALSIAALRARSALLGRDRA